MIVSYEYFVDFILFLILLNRHAITSSSINSGLKSELLPVDYVSVKQDITQLMTQSQEFWPAGTTIYLRN